MASKVNKGGELAKNTAIIAIGKIATQMVSFFLLPLYTAVLSVEEYGVVDIITTYVQLLLPVVTCQIEQAIFRFLLENRYDNEHRKEVLSVTFTLVSITTGVFTAGYLVISPLLNSEFKYFLLLNLIAHVYTALMLQVARGFGMNGAYATGSFIAASGQVAFNILFVLIFRFGAYGMLTASILAYFISGTYLLVRTKAYRYIRFVKIGLKRSEAYLKYSLPLVPNVISWWILSASDRTIITYFLGVGTNGIYSAACKFSSIYTQIYNIFNLSWTESVALHLKEKGGDADYTELQSTVIRFFSCFFLGITATMPFVFRILVNEKFSAAYYQIPILLMGAFFSAMTGVLGAYYVAEKMTAVIAKMTMAAAALNIIINLLLVRKFGLFAASGSTLLSYFTVFAIRYLDVRKRFNVKIEKWLALATLGMTMLIWTTYYLGIMVLCGVVLGITVIYSIIMNYQLLKSALTIVKKRVDTI